jgi:muconolactone delta-isomerase
MDYLVTMTTHVPDGTPAEQVDDVRAREAAHSRDLADRGHLLRLWRPPPRPGEWRTLGLFAAEDEDRLAEVLASMPLRVWRSDEVTPLPPHPNDPDPRPAQGPPEFLTAFTTVVPDGTAQADVADLFAGEACESRELAGRGHLLRLWRLPPGGPGALGLWRARDETELRTITDALPLVPWMTTEITPLTGHPNDPRPASGGMRP